MCVGGGRWGAPRAGCQAEDLGHDPEGMILGLKAGLPDPCGTGVEAAGMVQARWSLADQGGFAKGERVGLAGVGVGETSERDVRIPGRGGLQGNTQLRPGKGAALGKQRCSSQRRAQVLGEGMGVCREAPRPSRQGEGSLRLHD